MSDFLNDLATRTLGLESSVQPRLPSLFGPPTQGRLQQLSPVSGPWSEEVETGEAEGGVGDFPRPGRAAVFPPSQRDRRREAQSASSEAHWESEPALRREVPAPDRMVASDAPPNTVEVKAKSASYVGVVAASGSATARADELGNPVTGGVSSVSALGIPAGSVFPATKEVQSEQRRGGHREVVSRAESDLGPGVSRSGKSDVGNALHSTDSLPLMGTRLQETPVVRPTVKPVTHPAFAVEDRRGEAAPQPTIQVTIGRIEVRASSAPRPGSSAQPAKGRAKAMGLEDYLRQREGSQGGGGRR